MRSFRKVRNFAGRSESTEVKLSKVMAGIVKKTMETSAKVLHKGA